MVTFVPPRCTQKAAWLSMFDLDEHSMLCSVCQLVSPKVPGLDYLSSLMFLAADVKALTRTTKKHVLIAPKCLLRMSRISNAIAAD